MTHAASYSMPEFQSFLLRSLKKVSLIIFLTFRDIGLLFVHVVVHSMLNGNSTGITTEKLGRVRNRASGIFGTTYLQIVTMDRHLL